MFDGRRLVIRLFTPKRRRQAESVRSCFVGVLRGPTFMSHRIFFEMCVPPAESASFPQRVSTSRAGGADACRAPPPAVASQYGWGWGARRGRGRTAWARRESQVLFRRLRAHYIHITQHTFSCCTFRLLSFFCELGPRPSGLGYSSSWTMCFGLAQHMRYLEHLWVGCSVGSKRKNRQCSS